MSAAEALRRCPHAVFVRPRHSLYKDYSREVWSRVREIVPTVEQAGIDEGYLDLGEVAPVFDDARALAEAVQAVVRARTRLSCSLGVATSKVVAKVASDRHKPGGLTVVRPGREAAFLAPVPDPDPPGRRAARGGAPRPARDRDDRRHRRAHRRRPAAGPARQGRPRAARPRARHRPAAARGLDRAHLDLAGGDVRPRHRRPGAAARRAAPHVGEARRASAGPRPGRPHGHDQGSLPGLRDPDPLDLAGGRHRRGRTDRRARLLTARPRPARPARARCGSSGSASPAWRSTCNFPCPLSSESLPAVGRFFTVSVYAAPGVALLL